jgi:hypothetical protein
MISRLLTVDRRENGRCATPESRRAKPREGKTREGNGPERKKREARTRQNRKNASKKKIIKKGKSHHCNHQSTKPKTQKRKRKALT